MLEIEREARDAVLVLKVKGRFDGYGASLFDEEVALLGTDHRDIIVDTSDVSYLSSAGIRSLIKLEKTLASRSGGIILTGLTPSVKSVLELSGMLVYFRCAESLDEASIMASGIQTFEDTGREHPVHGRRYTVRTLPGEGSKLDLWGPLTIESDADLSPRNLIPVSLQELGPGFGIGGLGQDRFQAAQVLGEFVAAGGFAGVVPADGHGLSDYILTEQPSESIIYVLWAVALSGRPSFLFEEKGDAELTMAELVHDIFDLLSELKRGPSPVIAMVLFGEAGEIVGSHFRESHDIVLSRPEKAPFSDSRGAMVVGVAADERGLQRVDGMADPRLVEPLKGHRLGDGPHAFHGHGLKLSAFRIRRSSTEVDETVREAVRLEDLEGVTHMEPQTRIRAPRLWIYTPSVVRSAAEKRLEIAVEGEDEFLDAWDVIARRVFRDASRVVLTPIHGGYMSKTFHAASYGRDGRRMLPTVLKIGPMELTLREEQAYRKYVATYILNNSTSIMATASYGDWAGICYSFVGIGGPDSELSWLTDHYRARPTEKLIPLFENIFTNILKPWYGQPRWEEIFPYVEHDPLGLFPGIWDDAQRELGISPDAECLDCRELDMELPNPFHFLKHQYPARKGHSRLWYTAVTHGDLNMQNILLDERENIYIIDFSETRPRNIVSDFARLECILKIEMTHLESEDDLKALLGFELGLISASGLDQTPPWTYGGSDEEVEKAYRIICLLRGYADRVTLFERDMIPYLLALLQWTYPVPCYGSVSKWRKRFAAYSAGIIVRRILELEKS